MKGEWFEVKTAALLYLRGLNSNLEFQLGSNVEQARNFDDIVLKYRNRETDDNWHTCFIQLKHKERAWLDSATLINSDRGGFSLKKYLKSFSDIKKKMSTENDHDLFIGPFDKCDFVLYTNAPMSKELADRRRNIPIGSVESLLKTSQKNEKIVGFCKESDRDIYRALESSGPDSFEFLEKLKVFSGQPSEEEMDDVIKTELKITCKDNKSDVDVIYRFFIDAVKQWWGEDEVVFLTHNSTLLQRAMDQYKTFTFASHEKLIHRLAVKFQTNSLVRLKKMLEINRGTLFIFCDDIPLRLCCTKVMQILREDKGSYTFVGLECLFKKQNTILNGWASGTQTYLVILSNDTDIDSGELSFNITQVLITKPYKRIVMICKSKREYLPRTIPNFISTHRIMEMRECFEIVDLEPESYKSTIETEIILQGYRMSLETLLEDSNVEAGKFVKKNIVELVTENAIVVGKERWNNSKECSSRYLERRDILKREVLHSKVSDVFAVDNVSYNDLDTTGILAVIIETEKDFYKLCEKNKVVHWIGVENGLLMWKATHGNMQNICEFFDNEKRTAHNPKTSLNFRGKLVLLVEEFFPEKMALSSYLAIQTKKVHPELWIIEINLVEHYCLLAKDCDPVVFLQTASDIDVNRKFHKDLLHFCMHFSKNVIVFLENFHEVPEQHRDDLLNIIKNLMQTNVLQIVVTSSFAMKEYLEYRLSTVAYTSKELNLIRDIKQLMKSTRLY